MFSSKLSSILVLLATSTSLVFSLPTSDLSARQGQQQGEGQQDQSGTQSQTQTQSQVQQEPFTGWADGYYIAAVAVDRKCLAPSQSPAQAGTEVIATDCDQADTWRIPIQQQGGAVIHEKSQLVLDLGDGYNGGKLTLQNQTGDYNRQTFHYGFDNRLTAQNGTKCIDEGQEGPQVWQCYAENTRQVWLIRQDAQPQGVKDLPVGNIVNTTHPNFSFLHPKEREDICVSAISNSNPQDQQGLALTYCQGKGFTKSGYNTSQDLMEWGLPGSSYAGQVQLGYSGLCLEVGANVINETTHQIEYQVKNGMAVRTATCSQQSPGQTWTWNEGLLKSSVKNSNHCLNFAAEAGYVKMDNFLNLRPLQVWDCSNPDGQFEFST